jgi:transcriptional regulator with XRE-family HTH domain
MTTGQHSALTMTGGQELGVWLRQQREARTWARPEMARQLIKAAQANGDTSMPGVDSLTHNIYRWERGTVSPSERYRLYLCQALRIPPADFGAGQGAVQAYRFRFPGAEMAELFRLLADFVAVVRDLRAALRSSAWETAAHSAPGAGE